MGGRAGGRVAVVVIQGRRCACPTVFREWCSAYTCGGKPIRAIAAEDAKGEAHRCAHLTWNRRRQEMRGGERQEERRKARGAANEWHEGGRGQLLSLGGVRRPGFELAIRIRRVIRNIPATGWYAPCTEARAHVSCWAIQRLGDATDRTLARLA